MFLDYLRAAASLIVVYAHLIAGRAGADYSQSVVSESVSRFLIHPFGIVQNFGFFCVAIFFLISGFVVAHVSLKESPSEFLLKRFFRIFPPLAIAIAISFTISLVLYFFTLLLRSPLCVFQRKSRSIDE
ncbi:acyltransferase family protein [Vibrio qingdaonensis]|uniref:acyltransferase family protein n=1 Tax=Vibrio qingdaonensis TaxID=2829491 RepID=UPI0036F3FC3E